ncbi:MAG: hypothetical protein R3F51_13340 [Cyanobacteriota/Melainabacteria group bacterium]
MDFARRTAKSDSKITISTKSGSHTQFHVDKAVRPKAQAVSNSLATPAIREGMLWAFKKPMTPANGYQYCRGQYDVPCYRDDIAEISFIDSPSLYLVILILSISSPSQAIWQSSMLSSSTLQKVKECFWFKNLKLKRVSEAGRSPFCKGMHRRRRILYRGRLAVW